MGESGLPLGLLGALLFSLIGPISVMPKFAALTGGLDPAARRRVALLAALYATVALVLAAVTGAASLAKFGISKQALILAAGLLLLVISLRNVVPGAAPAAAAQPEKAAPSALALSPLAVPGIVHPVGVCVLVLFAAYFPALEDRLAVAGLVCGLMLVNYLAMLAAPAFMRLVGMGPLIILGAVFGVLQVALGIQFILSGLARLPPQG